MNYSLYSTEELRDVHKSVLALRVPLVTKQGMTWQVLFDLSAELLDELERRAGLLV